MLSFKRQHYYRNPLKCERCGKVISFEKRIKKKFGGIYCGNSCSVISTNKHKFTDDVRARISVKQRNNQLKIWTKEKREQHSAIMRQCVENSPSSYSSHRVCGRVKPVSVIDSYGNQTRCLGSWELLVSKYLTDNGIQWTNNIDEKFYYSWNGNIHRYFPDFLTDRGYYIEVKGYERDRDKAKWSQFPKKLVVIKIDDVKGIKSGKYVFPD